MATGAVVLAVSVAACSGRAVSGPAAQPQPAAASSTAATPSTPSTSAPPASPTSGKAPATSRTARPRARKGAAPRFRASVVRISPAWRSRLPYSWHQGCPQPLSGLALIRMTYWGFDKRAHTGKMVVNATVTSKIIQVFSVLYRARYPIRRMVLVDVYHGVDSRSTNADNTSAFNCRFVAGTSGWSMHAYGLAIDLNPCENVYIVGSHVDPPRCAANADRSRQVPGLIHDGDLVTRAFASVGWRWGGLWSSPKDYQHFSSNGK